MSENILNASITFQARQTRVEEVMRIGASSVVAAPGAVIVEIVGDDNQILATFPMIRNNFETMTGGAFVYDPMSEKYRTPEKYPEPEPAEEPKDEAPAEEEKPAPKRRGRPPKAKPAE